jgi:6-oxo-cyclohex-1-ene-carbonyl-CoA hydrolase
VDLYQPFPACLIKSVEGIRLKKKFFWDQAKVINRHWLAANMNGEALPGLQRLQHQKDYRPGYHRLHRVPPAQAAGDAFDVEFMAAVLGRPA